MISVVTWKWKPKLGYRSTFGPETVNTLAAMVGRNYPHPHRFICVTDEPKGIDSSVEVLPAWNDFANVPSPHGGAYPSCYRRLRMFHPDAAQWFGERFVSLDLDTVITSDLTPLWHRSEDFVIWGDTNPTTLYNGSMVLLTAAARSKVWTDFDPVKSPRIAKADGQHGSDQGWISYCLGRGEAIWTKADGVYSYRNHIATNGNQLAADARIVFFHGRHDPWDAHIQRIPWVRSHYRIDRPDEAVAC